MWRIPGVIDGTEEENCISISSGTGSPINLHLAVGHAEGPTLLLECGVGQIHLGQSGV